MPQEEIEESATGMQGAGAHVVSMHIDRSIAISLSIHVRIYFSICVVWRGKAPGMPQEEIQEPIAGLQGAGADRGSVYIYIYIYILYIYIYIYIYIYMYIYVY